MITLPRASTRMRPSSPRGHGRSSAERPIACPRSAPLFGEICPGPMVPFDSANTSTNARQRDRPAIRASRPSSFRTSGSRSASASPVGFGPGPPALAAGRCRSYPRAASAPAYAHAPGHGMAGRSPASFSFLFASNFAGPAATRASERHHVVDRRRCRDTGFLAFQDDRYAPGIRAARTYRLTQRAGLHRNPMDAVKDDQVRWRVHPPAGHERPHPTGNAPGNTELPTRPRCRHSTLGSPSHIRPVGGLNGEPRLTAPPPHRGQPRDRRSHRPPRRDRRPHRDAAAGYPDRSTASPVVPSCARGCRLPFRDRRRPALQTNVEPTCTLEKWTGKTDAMALAVARRCGELTFPRLFPQHPEDWRCAGNSL